LSQTITFGALSAKNYGDADFSVAASASSNLTVSFASQTSSVCTVSSSTVHLAAAGTCTIRASQAGDATYSAAPNVDQSFTVSKATPVISITNVPVTYDGSGHAAVFAGAAGSFSHIRYNGTGSTPTNAGSYTVTADFAPTDATNYSSLSGATAGTIVINQASSSTTVSCTGPVTYTGSAQTPCAVSVTGAGSLSLTPTPVYGSNTNAGTASASYTYAGDTNHTGSSNSANFTINKASATITVTPYSVTYDGFSHTSLGSAVGVLLETISGLIVSGTTHTTAGDYASDAWSFTGTANYNSANGTVHNVINKAGQTISFSVADHTFGEPAFGLSASASSGNPVSFAVLSGNCTWDGSSLTLTDAGDCTIEASQAGDTNYNAAPVVDAHFNIAAADQTISFGSLADATYGDADFQVSASVSSGLSVSFAANGDCTVSGSTVNITGAGSCTITASQLGNSSYNAASSVQQTFAIAKADADIVIADYSGVYDGFAHGVTGSATGVNGEDLSASLDLGATYTNVPGGIAHWVFTGDTNYNDADDDADVSIAKADATIRVTPYTVVDDGQPHTATGSATGVLGEDLTASLNLSATTHSILGLYTDEPWTFTDVTGNYNDDHGLVIDFITPFSGSGGGSGLRPAGQVLGVSTTTVATSTTSIATSTLTTMPDTKPTMNESTTTPGTVLGASTFDFTKNLRYRMTDPDVGELQKALVAAGYAIPDAVTNYFGAQTLAAVKAFQKAQGLPMTGLVGVQTRAALNGINSATSSQ
jgi:hypothetical protein